ncbi:MAG: hypothetical protein ACE5D7_06445 [Fidelibacterota bacterium]
MIKKQNSDPKLIQNDVIRNFPWVVHRDRKFITSADYDGLICAVYLHHTLNWQLTGFYDLQNIWISDEGANHKDELIWVDLNILPKQGKAIGGHIISVTGENPKGFETSCNPNIMLKLTANDFEKKYPFSTLLFLLWLNVHKPQIDDLFRGLILQSDASWLKYQNYPSNTRIWMKILGNYPWEELFKGVNTAKFEDVIHKTLIPALIKTGAILSKGKLTGKHKNRVSYQLKVNPDWDTDVIYRLFDLIGTVTGWTPPDLPIFSRVIEGKRRKIELHQVIKTGLNTFLKENKVFSYAITSPDTLNYTSFLNSKTLISQ